jgi:hypothetical protein
VTCESKAGPTLKNIQRSDINKLPVVVLPRRHHFNSRNSRHQLVSNFPCLVKQTRIVCKLKLDGFYAEVQLKATDPICTRKVRVPQRHSPVGLLANEDAFDW